MKKRVLLTLLCLAMICSLCAQASPVKEIPTESCPDFDEGDRLLKVYFVNTHGASDAMVLTFGEKTMIIDCGDTNYAALYVKPLLDELGITHVDYCFNTHPHDDHINGFLSLFDLIDVDVFYTAFPFGYCKEQTAVINSAVEHNIEVIPVNNQSDISFDGLEIFLYQDPKYLTDNAVKANPASMMMHIRYGDSTLLITGDAEKPVFTDMNEVYGDRMQSDIVKMPHHGHNLLPYELFGRMDVKYAVITINVISKVADKAPQFLKNNRCPYTYTGRGTVEAATDGTRWTLRLLPLR